MKIYKYIHLYIYFSFSARGINTKSSRTVRPTFKEAICKNDITLQVSIPTRTSKCNTSIYLCEKRLLTVTGKNVTPTNCWKQSVHILLRNLSDSRTAWNSGFSSKPHTTFCFFMEASFPISIPFSSSLSIQASPSTSAAIIASTDFFTTPSDFLLFKVSLMRTMSIVTVFS